MHLQHLVLRTFIFWKFCPTYHTAPSYGITPSGGSRLASSREPSSGVGFAWKICGGFSDLFEACRCHTSYGAVSTLSEQLSWSEPCSLTRPEAVGLDMIALDDFPDLCCEWQVPPRSYARARHLVSIVVLHKLPVPAHVIAGRWMTRVAATPLYKPQDPFGSMIG